MLPFRPGKNLQRATRAALLSLLLVFATPGAAEEGRSPIKLKIGSTYLCHPAQGWDYRIKVAEVDGMWVRGEITVAAPSNIQVLPQGGIGWINLRNVLMVLEEKS